MSVRQIITEHGGVYFITFTCTRWLPLFELTNGYQVVYNWFDYLKQQGHHMVGYVIMPNHVHVMIAFCNNGKSINSIVGNGKRFMAYDLVKRLKEQGKENVLAQLSQWVNNTDKKRNKQHEVFELSFDHKECRTIEFMKQKVEYMHLNPCRYATIKAKLPEDYEHSSALYCVTGRQGVYPVITYMELQDIDLS